MNLKLSLFGIGILLTVSECAKIIFVFPTASKSHKNVIRPLAHELAARGNQVTMVSPFKDEKVIENLKEIAIDANQKTMEESGKEMMEKLIQTNQNIMPTRFLQFSIIGTKSLMNDSGYQSLLAEGIQFDLAIVSMFANEAGLLSSYLIAKHVALLSPVSMLTPAPSSPPTPLATVPTLLFRFPSEMNFFQRLFNAVGATVLWNVFRYYTFDEVEKICREHNLNVPTMDEAKRKVCLTFFNADTVMSSPRPGMRNVVPIGGIHCKPAKPLSKDFSDFIDSSGEEGFIYFSLGTIMQGKFLSKETQKEIIRAFSRLNQKVIWKFEEKLDNLPNNVMLTSWAPQQDILGHPKIRLFITHGGLLSTQESIYYGVPLIGIPLFGDQPANVDRIMELGIGDSLDLSNITADVFYSKIQKILNDPSFKIKAEEVSAIARDQSVSSMERAIYWIEYVIRHDGADHLRSSAEYVDYFEYFCLDILLTLGIILSVIVFVTVKLIHFSTRSCREHVK